MTSYDKPGPLDGAIDRAVREMVKVDPRPGLRLRVTHSIKTPARRTHGFRLGLAALGLAMVAVVSIMVWRPSPPAEPARAPQVAAATPAAPAPPLAGPQAGQVPVAPPSAPDVAPVQPRRRVMPTPESIFGPRQGTVSAASVPPARAASAIEAFWLDVPVDAARWSSMTPITFQPLMVVPLAIQPLFVRGASPRQGPRR